MNNPYSAPGAALSGTASGHASYEPRLFAMKGRIGRVRYIAYLFGVSVLNMIPVMIIMGVLGATGVFAGNQEAMAGVSMLFYIPLLAFTFILAKRRFNDVNRSGWLALLLLVPFVNFAVSLYLLCAGGDEGDNDYGPPPSPNSTMVKVVALIFPAVFILGMLAAIAIPAYSDYTARAKAAAGARGL